MFGLTKKERTVKLMTDALGEMVYLQMREAMDERGELFAESEEMMFVSAYIWGLVAEAFDEIYINDTKLYKKSVNKICEGIIPNQLWDIVQRGLIANEVASESDGLDSFSNAFQEGKESAKDDFYSYKQGFDPSRLKYYLTSQKVEEDGNSFQADELDAQELSYLYAPDMEEHDGARIISIDVSVGDQLNEEDPIVTYEINASQYFIPSGVSGIVDSVFVDIDDKIKQGKLLMSYMPVHSHSTFGPTE
jgi:hypothetical protein